jgi:branched-chain amino acid transport system permease protein
VSPQLASLITGTLTTGAILSLISVGFVIIYRATKVVSFAQGAFSLLGGFIFMTLAQHHVGLALALVITLVVTLAAGALTYLIVFVRLIGAEPFITAIATIGLGTLFEACAIIIWGSGPIILPSNVISARVYHLGGSLTVSVTQIFIVASAIVVFTLVITALHRTRLGLRVQAVADRPRLAAYVGVNVIAITTLAWAVAAATGAVGGVAFLVTSQPAPDSVYSLGLVVFPAILLGGLDSVAGALVGGILLAFVQNVVSTYVNGTWVDVVSYGLLLVVLLIRPQGLFGSAEVSRV